MKIAPWLTCLRLTGPTAAPEAVDRPLIRRWPNYLRAFVITGVCTGVSFPLAPYFGLVNVVMIYLLGTTLGALRLGRGPSLLNAALNALEFYFSLLKPCAKRRIIVSGGLYDWHCRDGRRGNTKCESFRTGLVE
jgi:K+-sensing histidine kinase KdpD